MAAYFRCKNCYQEHLCPLFFADEPAFSFCDAGPNIFRCPVTLKTAVYEKRDLFWMKEVGRPATHRVRTRV